MTAPPRNREPWTEADDRLLIVLCASVDRAQGGHRPRDRSAALAATCVAESGRTALALQARLRLLHARGDVGPRGAQRASVALGSAAQAERAERQARRPPAPPKPPPGPPKPLPELARKGRDLGPRPPHAPPPETWPDGVDPWRAALHQRGIGATDRQIAALLSQICDPRCAPARTIAGPATRGGLWSADDVRALLGS